MSIDIKHITDIIIDSLWLNDLISSFKHYEETNRIICWAKFEEDMDMDKTKNVTDIIQNITIVLAIIIGGIWALIEFSLTKNPSIIITNDCQHTIHDDGSKLLTLYVNIENVGNLKKSYPTGSCILLSIFNLSPKEEKLQQLSGKIWINFPKDEYSGESGIYNRIDGATFTFKETKIIMSADKEKYFFTFHIPEEIEVVMVYSSIRDKEDKILEKGEYNIYELK